MNRLTRSYTCRHTGADDPDPPMVIWYVRPPGDNDSRHPDSSAQARKRRAGFSPDQVLLSGQPPDSSASSTPTALDAFASCSMFSKLPHGPAPDTAPSPPPDTPGKPPYGIPTP